MKKVVITGATGMIGVSLIESLLANKVEKIYAVVRENSQKLARLPKSDRIVIVPAELSDYDHLAEKIGDTCEVFYHFAWAATGGPAIRNSKIDLQAENIPATLKAMDAARALGCTKFIGAGSQAEFGLCKDPFISPESVCNPIQPYGIAKYAAGKLALAKAEILDMDCFWVRIFSIYGTRDRANSMVMMTVNTLLEGGKPSFTPAEQRWDYLEESDTGNGFRMIGEHATGRKIYCIGSGDPHTLKDYIYAIRDEIDPALEVGIGDMPYPKGAVMNLAADISSLTADTGWKPQVSFRQGIRRILRSKGFEKS